MSGNSVIQVADVWKKYRLGVLGTGTLRHDLGRWWHHLRGKPDPYATVGPPHRPGGRGGTRSSPETAGPEVLEDDEVWALRGVSFEVRQGEVLGIIGRNGAGKSTLLKILSRVTAPTHGEVRLRGRIASLLEVGTGFHPELTGRENVFLNGAILGMTKDEIRDKLDEIVAFAEIDAFLDTPVKRYSSGMHVRLAFAVAAHVDPEVLIVDEVLAVGDAEFQQKCLGKMQDVSQIGRTILFVSHDMNNITRLCRKGIVLNQGGVEAQGDIMDVVAHYREESISEKGYADLTKRRDRSGNGDAAFESVELLSSSGRSSIFAIGRSMTVRTTLGVRGALGGGAHVAVLILTTEGTPVHGLENLVEGMPWRPEAGAHVVSVTIPQLALYPGDYVVDLWISDDQRRRVDYLNKAISFRVIQTADSRLGLPLSRSNGLVYAGSQWRFERVAD